jgi:hypothetical protein
MARCLGENMCARRSGNGPAGTKIGSTSQVLRGPFLRLVLSGERARMLTPINSFEWPPATPAQQRRKVR